MAKVHINGEVFDWDTARQPMSEALAIEAALQCRYADWQSDMAAGSARALCGFIWLVWRRNGRDVPFDDILTGKVEIDRATFEIDDDDDDEDAGDVAAVPTMPPPEPTPTTSDGT